VVMIDLLTGVVVGIGVAVGRLFYIFTHLKIDVQRDEARNRTILRPTGAATFVRLPQLAAVLESVAGDTELHVHLEDLRYIDHACFDLLMNWERQHEAKGGRLVIDWDELGAKVSGEAVLPPLDAPRPGREPVSMS
jgi:MFS superfamily sulfate permease-like transporter